MWPFTRKPATRVVFSRSKDAARKQLASDQDKTAKLVAELSASGRYVPEFYRHASQKGGAV